MHPCSHRSAPCGPFGVRALRSGNLTTSSQANFGGSSLLSSGDMRLSFVAAFGTICAGVTHGTCEAAAEERAVEDCEIVGDEHELLVTGYCNCGKCCGWRKKWFFFGEPVYNYGKMKGAPKKVGVTASGAVAAKGTIAADPAVYPFGTRIGIPGYGLGIVQDVGGSIKGAHIDIWFPSHAEALAWGGRKLKVKVAKKEAKEKQMGRESAGTDPAKR